LPEEIQRFIAEQVAKEVQEKLKNAGNVGAEPAAKKKSTKGKEKEDVQVPQKKKKVKEKKDKFANGLGTGLSPGDSRIVIAGQGHSILHGTLYLLYSQSSTDIEKLNLFSRPQVSTVVRTNFEE